MDQFDLFDKPLSFQETLQYDSLITNGSYDPQMMLLATIMNNPDYKPTAQASKNIMQHINNPNKPVPQTIPNKPEPQTIPNKRVPQTTEPKTVQKNSPKQNVSRKYIKLPNATISKHCNKYESIEN